MITVYDLAGRAVSVTNDGTVNIVTQLLRSMILVLPSHTEYDKLGSVVGMLGTNGNVSANYRYDAFGNKMQ